MPGPASFRAAHDCRPAQQPREWPPHRWLRSAARWVEPNALREAVLAAVQVDLGDRGVDGSDFDIAFVGNRNIDDVKNVAPTGH